ncbi:hypothetical protein BDD12DRAFT_806397 [Trichophaea hybrida]|nr:hypothetical protein BDD12DRAFT_806397 [Trichophaea hybrida]
MDVEMEKRIARSGDVEFLKPISEFATIDHFTSFGRPLWRIYVNQSYEALKEFAVVKMLGGVTKYDPTHPQHVFAPMAAWLCIDPCENTKCGPHLDNAINYHLRYMYRMNTTNGWLSTLAGSEPVLADYAACIQMQPDREYVKMSNTPFLNPDSSAFSVWWQSINTYAERQISRGPLDIGMREELFLRLMCILTGDLLLHEAPTNQ